MTKLPSAPVSIVCVFNDEAQLASCLRRSIETGHDTAPSTELIAVDNRDGRFANASAALNHGARLARHEVIAFAHQDVYLHSLPTLEEVAAALLARPAIGLVGAVGVMADGAVAGVVRDRVVMIGTRSQWDTDVASVDEVIFLLRRSDVLSSPLLEDPRLGWHAYAVEYCARLHHEGRGVATADMLVTHNSLTVNLAGLADAHARVAELHPGELPLATTCGVVRAREPRMTTLARRRRGAATWVRESRIAAQVAAQAGTAALEVVLGDIRLEIDDALDQLGSGALTAVHVAPEVDSRWDVDGLPRRGRLTRLLHATPSTLAALLSDRGSDEAILVTGDHQHWIPTLLDHTTADTRLLGVHGDTGAWALVSRGATAASARWQGARHRPVFPIASARPRRGRSG